MTPLLAAAALALGYAGAAQAKIDCPTADRRPGAAICRDPALGGAYRAMLRAYSQTLAITAPARRDTIVVQQQAIVAAADRACRTQTMPDPERYDVCLARRFAARATALHTETVRLAPFTYVFARTHREKAIPKTSENYNANVPFLSEDARYVTIAHGSAAAGRFNAGMRHWGRESLADGYGGEQPGDPFRAGERGGTPSLEQSVVAASSELASVASNFSAYWGGAHPVEGSQFRHWSFRLGRPLRTGEILRRTDDPALIALVRRRFRGEHTGMSMADCPDFIRRVTLDEMSIDRDGLTYWMVSRPCFGRSRLRWAVLHPFLARALPFDPRRLRTNAYADLPF